MEDFCHLAHNPHFLSVSCAYDFFSKSAGTCAKSLQSCLTLQCYGLYPASLLGSWDSPGKNTGVGCHALLQGIFLIQGLNHISYVSCISRQALYHYQSVHSVNRDRKITLQRKKNFTKTISSVINHSQSMFP